MKVGCNFPSAPRRERTLHIDRTEEISFLLQKDRTKFQVLFRTKNVSAPFVVNFNTGTFLY